VLTIKVNIDPLTLLEGLRKSEKRMVYALTDATNSTLGLAQRVQQDRVLRMFTIRRPDFIRREAAKILFANVRATRVYGEIYVGDKSRLILASFEEGGQRPRARDSVAVPITGSPARPSFPSPVPTPLFYKRLFPGRSRKAQKGRAGAYVVPDVGIFVRQQGQESELVYKFDEDVRVPKKLGFEATVERVALEWFPRYIQQNVQKELARAGF
jgi:hypothetical protein